MTENWKNKKGNCEVTQRLIIARKKVLSPIQGCRTKGKTCHKNPGATRSTCGKCLNLQEGVWLVLKALRGNRGLAAAGIPDTLDTCLSRGKCRTSRTTNQWHSNPFQRRQEEPLLNRHKAKIIYYRIHSKDRDGQEIIQLESYKLKVNAVANLYSPSGNCRFSTGPSTFVEWIIRLLWDNTAGQLCLPVMMSIWENAHTHFINLVSTNVSFYFGLFEFLLCGLCFIEHSG